jgi:hypothetical protein
MQKQRRKAPKRIIQARPISPAESARGQSPPVQLVSKSHLIEIIPSTLRANLFPEVTDLSCRLPLPTLFYRLEATHLGDLMRL